MKRVAVVILNWNGKKFLEQFLQNVVDNSCHVADVIVADNNSNDGSVDFVTNNFQQVKVIRLDDNYGFAGGYNRALQQIDYEYFILLNSDIEVSSRWIEPVVDFMDNYAEYAICQPKLLSYFEKDKFEYAGAAGGYIDHLGYPFCRGRVFQELEVDNGQYDNFTEVFWATGACMFVKSSVFKEIGGLDEDFFAHMEEIDFWWRAKNRGYKVGYCPNSIVYHIGGGTLPKQSSFKTYLNMRNNITMLYKNLPKNRVFPVLFARIFLDFIAAFKFFIDGGIKDFWAVMRAHFYFYSNLKKKKKKRKSLPHNKVSCMYLKSIVFGHFFHNITKFSQLDENNFSKTEH